MECQQNISQAGTILSNPAFNRAMDDPRTMLPFRALAAHDRKKQSKCNSQNCNCTVGGDGVVERFSRRPGNVVVVCVCVRLKLVSVAKRDGYKAPLSGLAREPWEYVTIVVAIKFTFHSVSNI